MPGVNTLYIRLDINSPHLCPSLNRQFCAAEISMNRNRGGYWFTPQMLICGRPRPPTPTGRAFPAFSGPIHIGSSTSAFQAQYSLCADCSKWLLHSISKATFQVLSTGPVLRVKQKSIDETISHAHLFDLISPKAQRHQLHFFNWGFRYGLIKKSHKMILKLAEPKPGCAFRAFSKVHAPFHMERCHRRFCHIQKTRKSMPRSAFGNIWRI